jgi:hypothetical protein
MKKYQSGKALPDCTRPVIDGLENQVPFSVFVTFLKFIATTHLMATGLKAGPFLIFKQKHK